MAACSLQGLWVILQPSACSFDQPDLSLEEQPNQLARHAAPVCGQYRNAGGMGDCFKKRLSLVHSSTGSRGGTVSLVELQIVCVYVCVCLPGHRYNPVLVQRAMMWKRPEMECTSSSPWQGQQAFLPLDEFSFNFSEDGKSAEL